MKKFLLILSALIIVLFTAGCTGGNEPNSDETTGSTNSGTVMNIQIGDNILTAELADNSSAEALAEMLREGDITINMSDYGNMEKVGALPESLPRNDEQINTKAGDLILYQGNSFVIYYDTNSWNFTRLGKIIDITEKELKDILGSGNVEVTLSLLSDTTAEAEKSETMSEADNSETEAETTISTVQSEEPEITLHQSEATPVTSETEQSQTTLEVTVTTALAAETVETTTASSALQTETTRATENTTASETQSETAETTAETTSETAKEETEMKMNIQIGDNTLTATLAPNSSTEALLEMLREGDITINMSDYANMEKVGPFPESLPRNDEQITTEAGDLILYLGNSFVIYYDTNSWNFTRLGKIDNITQKELKDILGSGNVTAVLSLPTE